jgi:hypothetical protein
VCTCSAETCRQGSWRRIMHPQAGLTGSTWVARYRDQQYFMLKVPLKRVLSFTPSRRATLPDWRARPITCAGVGQFHVREHASHAGGSSSARTTALLLPMSSSEYSVVREEARYLRSLTLPAGGAHEFRSVRRSSLSDDLAEAHLNVLISDCACLCCGVQTIEDVVYTGPQALPVQ